MTKKSEPPHPASETLRERILKTVVRERLVPWLDDALSTWGLCVAREPPKPAIRIKMRDPLSQRLRRLQRRAARWKARA
jgi:hypothetical protein